MIVARLVFAKLACGSRTHPLMAQLGIEVEAWARKRLHAFKLLGIVEIIYEDIDDRAIQA